MKQIYFFILTNNYNIILREIVQLMGEKKKKENKSSKWIEM